jgi:uncharacterized protein with NRDE domain
VPKLTATFVAKLPNPATGTRKHWDTEVRGFGLFAGKRSKTWYFQRDFGGQTRRLLIGRYPVISASAARQAAQTALNAHLLRFNRQSERAVAAKTLELLQNTCGLSSVRCILAAIQSLKPSAH